MIQRSIYSLLVTVLFGTAAIAQQSSDPKFDRMLKDLIDFSIPVVLCEEVCEDTAVFYLDAREPEEFEVSHIAGAVNVGYDDPDLSVMDRISSEQKIVVYCSVGYRSEKIGERLREMGYTNVKNLYGGIFEWSNKQLPVVNDEGKTTKVHAYDKSWGKWLRTEEKVY